MAFTPVQTPILSQFYLWTAKKSNLLFSIALCLIFCFLCFQGPMLAPDSGGYIHGATIRSPLYPLLLKLYIKIFGFNNFQCLVIFQILAGFIAAIFTAKKMSQCTSVLPKNVFYLILLVLLFPYYSHAQVGNMILTEALCYPMFLLLFSRLLEGLQNKNTRALLWSMALSGLLVLTRGQFLFLYPALGILLFYIILFERKIFKTGLLVVCLILTIIGSNLAERTYQYINHGQFKLVPFTGIQLVIAPLFLARETDQNLFTEPNQKALFKEVWSAMNQKKLNFSSLNLDSYVHMTTYIQFSENYNPICWATLAPLLSKHGLETPYQIDTTLTSMAIKLILNNLKGFFTLYILNIVLNIGGLYFMLLLCVATLAALFAFVKTQSPLALVYLLASLLTAGNYTLVALVEPMLRRYAIYTNTLQICVLLMLVVIAFSHTTQPKIKLR